MILLYLFISYLIGSLSGSLILGKLWKVDIREMGSGNAGGTNALRSVGVGFGILTFLIDLTKGIIPPLIVSGNLNLMLCCGIMSVLGHVYPIFYNFKGGKGAGTLLGVLCVVLPDSVPYILLVWFLVVVLTGYVGLSTIIAIFTILPYSIINASINHIVFSFTIFLFIIYTHRDNIIRMINGVENQFTRVMIFSRNKKGS